MERKCLNCGQPARYRFFARRKGFTETEVLSSDPTSFMGSGLLRHDRYRFVCGGCWQEVRERLIKRGFELGGLEDL